MVQLLEELKQTKRLIAKFAPSDETSSSHMPRLKSTSNAYSHSCGKQQKTNHADDFDWKLKSRLRYWDNLRGCDDNLCHIRIHYFIIDQMLQHYCGQNPLFSSEPWTIPRERHDSLCVMVTERLIIIPQQKTKKNNDLTMKNPLFNQINSNSLQIESSKQYLHIEMHTKRLSHLFRSHGLQYHAIQRIEQEIIDQANMQRHMYYIHLIKMHNRKWSENSMLNE